MSRQDHLLSSHKLLCRIGLSENSPSELFTVSALADAEGDRGDVWAEACFCLIRRSASTPAI